MSLSSIVARQHSSFGLPISFLQSFGALNYGSSVKSKIELPKRPLNAFVRFAEETRKTLPKVTMIEASKIIGKKWHELPEDQRKMFSVQAKKDHEKWKDQLSKILDNPLNKELLQEHDSDKKKRLLRRAQLNLKKLETEAGKPKRASNPYVMFFTTQQAPMLQKNPKLKAHEIMELIAEEWQKLPQDQKEKYIQMSEKEQKEYPKAMAAWTEKMKESGQAEVLLKAVQKMNLIKANIKDPK